MSDQKQRDAEADLASVAQKCHRCGGDGRLQNDEVCKECLGTGAEYPEALREIAVWWIAEALRMRTVLASIEEYGTEEINTAFELRTALARARAELTRQQVANEDLRAEVARLKQELGDTLVRSHNETAIIRGQLLQPSAVARLETWAKKHGGDTRLGQRGCDCRVGKVEGIVRVKFTRLMMSSEGRFYYSAFSIAELVVDVLKGLENQRRQCSISVAK